MLLDAQTHELTPKIDDVLAGLSQALVGHVSAETHASAVEIATGPHETVAGAVDELSALRAALAAELAKHGATAAASGTHPLAEGIGAVSPHARSQSVLESMRELARREPTFALHVHVAVPDPDMAVRALDGLRTTLPIFLALSANSPFWRRRDSGLASARTPIFSTFPRTGIPRSFGDWDGYVGAVDLLVQAGAIPEPTFLWWDARLQPRLGTLEVRVMDAQIGIDDVAALVALVQCAVMEAATAGEAPERVAAPPEVLEENRFLAARDGMDACLIDPVAGRRRPVRDWLFELLDRVVVHADDLGCADELGLVPALAQDPGAARQRERAGAGEPGDLRALVSTLTDDFREPQAAPGEA